MNQEYMQLALNSISGNAFAAKEEFAETAREMRRPAILLKPKLTLDGGQWCALYGENLMDGVCAFGNSPYEAYQNFDWAWEKNLKQKEVQS